jgi:hypothetical protein
MKQEKRFCHTAANQKTTWFRNFRPLLLRCLVLNCSGESGPGARRSPVHLDLHRRLASVYSMELPLLVLPSTIASASQTVTVSFGALSNYLALTITAGQNGSIYYQASVGSATVPAGTSKTLQSELAH